MTAVLVPRETGVCWDTPLLPQSAIKPGRKRTSFAEVFRDTLTRPGISPLPSPADWAGHTSGHTSSDHVPAAGQVVRFSEAMVEAPSGFEPEMEVLQTSALPLGDGADHSRGFAARPGQRRKEIGAGNGIRTRDFDLGKVALYH